ncbi:MAG: acyltransferase family protein [Deltaproteobacteria bacterium]|nr:acyltransferase family protein [Deltaproteobacteria bacterium]
MNPEFMQLMQSMLEAALKNPSVSGLVGQIKSIYARLTSIIETDDEFGMDPVFVNMLRPVFKFLYNDWWRVTADGIKNIPQKGPAIIVANHGGMLPFDAVMLNMAVYNNHKSKRNVRFLVADFVDNFPILSLFIQRAGGVKASHENASRLLSKGEVICVFPEGTHGIGKLYDERYRLKEFGRGGVIKLAKSSNAPVIPTAIVGAEDIYPVIWKFEEFGKKIGLPFFPVTPTFPLFGLFGLIPYPSKWTIKFGPQIKYAGARKPVDKLTTELKAEIQKMIDLELIRRSA